VAPSGFIFLRFFCAAILSPNLFQLMETSQSKQTPRNLMLISKVLMNLANMVEFGEKEQYMKVMNEFISLNTPVFKDYINNISTINPLTNQTLKVPYGEQMALIQSFLSSKINIINEMDKEKYPIIPNLLEELNKFSENDINVNSTRLKRSKSVVIVANITNENSLSNDKKK